MQGIVALPVEKGMPRIAVIGDLHVIDETEDVIAVAAAGVLACWSNDSGVWMVDGIPVPQGVSDAITERAREQGVW